MSGRYVLSLYAHFSNKRKRKPKGQSRMDNQEYWAHKTQDEDKQSRKTQHRKLKR